MGEARPDRRRLQPLSHRGQNLVAQRGRKRLELRAMDQVAQRIPEDPGVEIEIAQRASGAVARPARGERGGERRHALDARSEGRLTGKEQEVRQIADVVGVPENTVKSRMRYALEKLRLELDEYKDVAKAAL